ncbi:MAG: hypothetical protein RR949_00525 [Oscillospiraceae bacterium]
MKKNFKKLASLFLTLALVFSLAVPAFAAEAPAADQIQVSIYLQQVDVERNPSDFDEISSSTPIVVTIDSGKSVKDAIDAAVAQNSTITAATWQSGMFLNALTLDTTTYANQDLEYGTNYYKGISWMYFMGTPASMPLDPNKYPTEYMNQKILTENTSFTLSYETLVMEW